VIVLDSSALLAVLFDEPEAPRCIAAMTTESTLAISAGTLAEVRIVASRRGVRDALDRLLARLKPEIVAVAAAEAILVADAYASWGKGIHPAALYFGDCFAYALAKARGWKLLYTGDDFSRTDIDSA
jgi:ribonuclease VapC